MSDCAPIMILGHSHYPAQFPRHQHYLPDGAPCDLITWAKFIAANPNYFTIFDRVGPVIVATYYDGIATPTCMPEAIWSASPPMIYTTQVKGPGIEDCAHYPTRELAEQGHTHELELVREDYNAALRLAVPEGEHAEQDHEQ